MLMDFETVELKLSCFVLGWPTHPLCENFLMQFWMTQRPYKKSNSEMEWPRPPTPLDGKFHHVFTFWLRQGAQGVTLSVCLSVCLSVRSAQSALKH